jgi:predicted amidohydrolase YtcJ
MRYTGLLVCCVLFINFGCMKKKEKADFIVYNAKVYTVDSLFSKAEAFVIKDGKFVDVGFTKDILTKYESDQMLNLKNKSVLPGFIDPHCHFFGYGSYKNTVDLTGCKSESDLVERVQAFASQNNSTWIRGRGWDQNKWEGKAFPTFDKLNELFPDRPLLLIRVDGHAVLVNKAAMDLVSPPLNEIEEFMLMVDGEFKGILLDNGADLIKEAANKMNAEEIRQALLLAQKDCLEVGLTSISDAGLDRDVVEAIMALNESQEMKMRIYAMLNPNEESKAFVREHSVYKSDHLHVCSIKLYADGALGSRGACLCKPYTDDPNHYGFILHEKDYFTEYASFAYGNGYQVCTHAIGDSANRFVLDLYATYLKGKNDLRWRIEHAQVIDENDFQKFADYSIIPSIQTTHATSDMGWAVKRLGKERLKNAYAYKRLLNLNGYLPNGSDFPVEDINPLYGFYAAIARKDHDGKPEEGFQMENALSREEALKAMTIWAAKANFEEDIKGSIEIGKLADFVVVDQDIMTITETDIPGVKVLYTFIGGEELYSNHDD